MFFYDGEGSQLSIRSVSTEADLRNMLSSIAGLNFPSAGTALNWIAGQRDKMVVNRDPPEIVMEGLVLNLDAGFVPSYPTTGTTWYDLSGNGFNGTDFSGRSRLLITNGN